jgi:hypothetical protein
VEGGAKGPDPRRVRTYQVDMSSLKAVEAVEGVEAPPVNASQSVPLYKLVFQDYEGEAATFAAMCIRQVD